MRHFKGKIPIIFRGDSTLLDEPNGFSIKKWGRQQLLKWVYSYVDHALSPGTASDEYFKWVGLKSHQINRARHAVENERFMGEMENGNWELGNGRWEMENKAKKWRQELGILDDKKVFLFAGKFEPKKDPLLLIRAFKQLLQKRSDIHLIMVGNGILEEQIKKEISISQFPSTPSTPSTLSTQTTSFNFSQHSSTPSTTSTSLNLPQPPSTSLNFSQHSSTSSTPSTPSTTSTSLNLPQPPSTFPITFLPFQNQSLMPIIYRLGDVFILPSQSETWGLAINEAMASGRVVIASDKCGGSADLVSENYNGFIFKAGEGADLLKKMEAILDANIRTMGENARQLIRKFNYEDFVIALEKILK
jgi:glycosyltransferase involved in cell wall biosynthesis